MKIHVIADSEGNILGVVESIVGFDIRVIPLAGQRVVERDACAVLEGMEGAEEGSLGSLG